MSRTRKAPTELLQIETPEPPKVAQPADIRDAIISRIPTGQYMVGDVKVHDGLVEVSVQCGALRWQTCLGVSGRDPDAIGQEVETGLRTWIDHTLGNIFVDDELREVSAGKYRRAGRGFQLWLKSDPKARAWLNEAHA